MDKIHIRGGKALKGSVRISGAKNAALPLMVASLLTKDELRLSNLPHLMDIATMANLLVQHGIELKLDGCEKTGGHSGEVMLLNGANIHNFEAPYDIVRKMRASVLVLGPLLARFGIAKVSLPGGCAIGSRPIDLHLKALEQMGATIELHDGYIEAKVNGRLQGVDIHFEKVSVGATENILMAATLAQGTTVISNAAKEPEISDLAQCLVAMGADISGIGTATLTVCGVEQLYGASHVVVADRIEAGTYMVAAAITHGHLKLKGISPDLLRSTIDKLTEAGVIISESDSALEVKVGQGGLKATDAITQAYPGFPTDMQAQFMSLMCIAEGSSVIKETIFENRFMHVPELTRMGANILVDSNNAVVRGVPQLKGAELMATDLRASVSLVLAALAAQGETIINRMYHIDRGYERIEEKLSMCGAEIVRLKD